MARGKVVSKILLDSSQAALFAGVEIHNKPNIPYRYQTSIILIINAWELALKAFVYKYIGREKIYEDKEKRHTIRFTYALDIVRQKINADKGNAEFEAVCKNLYLLNDYRNNIAHFGNIELDAIVFMLLNKAVLNYDVFIKEYFNKDITNNSNLVILPIGFRLPMDPIDYLRKRTEGEPNAFVKQVMDSVKELHEKNIKETIVVGFDLCMASAKKIENADIVAAITAINPEVSVVKEYRITNNPNAPLVRGIEDIPPLRYQDLIDRIKAKRPDIKRTKVFHSVMREIKKDEKLCKSRYLDPDNKDGQKKDFYFEEAVDIIIKKYDDTMQEQGN